MSEKPDRYNPKYIAYASAHGRTPDEQMAADKIAYPGGCMAGYIIWISEQQRTAGKVHSETALAVVNGLRAGGKLSKLETGSHDYRMDFPNGDYWFLAETVVKELRAGGFIKVESQAKTTAEAPSVPYPMCYDAKGCAGKTYCPKDRACNE